MEEVKLNDFEISFALDKDLDVNKFLVGKDLEKLLNDNLMLSNYTSKFSTLFMLFQCFDPSNPYFNAKDKKIIRRKQNVVELYSLIDYNVAKNADENKIKSLLCATFLKSVKVHLNSKDFVYDLFINDLHKVFDLFALKEK